MENQQHQANQTQGQQPVEKREKVFDRGEENMIQRIFSTKNRPFVGTAQDHLPIVDIVDGIVLFKDGGAAIIMESTSLNFGLLSEREQEAVIAAYAAFINSLSFAAQIVIRTQKKDITSYMNFLAKKAEDIKSPKLKGLFNSYRNFVLETTRKRNVLGKRFFVVVPFSPLELGTKSSMASSISNKKRTLPFTKEYVLKKAKVSLGPKKDHVSRQAARLGLRLKQLNVVEITKLFKDIYSPNVETVRPSEEEQNLNDMTGDTQVNTPTTTGRQAPQPTAVESFIPPQQ